MINFNINTDRMINHFCDMVKIKSVTFEENNMAEYLDAGISGFGISSGIVDKKLVENGDFEKICELAKKYTKVIR